MTVELIAPAKLTVGLRITGVRADSYHLIDAEMVTLSLHDTLTITEVHGTKVRGTEIPGTETEGMPELTASGPYSAGMPLDGTNLVHRALRLANRNAAIHVDKQIPHGGGLGGGSSDAAAVLRWAGYTDLAGAATIGADVPFCLVGGRARVRGIGELVDPLPFVKRAFTLIIPPLTVSTPAAYAAWDALGGPSADGVNDLEPAAIAVEPRLAWWRDKIGNATGQTPVLAGSGATWFVHGEHDNALAALSNEGAKVVAVGTTPSTSQQ
ncbi:MAG TPA: 4-(cytidine 5'-diphospho)-2-C-methyl-D-erythritol kinase [Ilumatobacter sp.]|nr:4-(cytidine 5'-diphospho)-2-C-methyl-D-erythritol kinase [Ilumatobacter sp.]